MRRFLTKIWRGHDMYTMPEAFTSPSLLPLFFESRFSKGAGHPMCGMPDRRMWWVPAGLLRGRMTAGSLGPCALLPAFRGFGEGRGPHGRGQGKSGKHREGRRVGARFRATVVWTCLSTPRFPYLFVINLKHVRDACRAACCSLLYSSCVYAALC